MFPGYRIEDRGGIISITAPTGETIGGPGEIVVIDVIEKPKVNDILTPASAALIALGELPTSVTVIVDPGGKVITKI